MFGVRWTILSFSLSAVCIPLAAQTAQEQTGPRLVSPREGEAIVLAARDLQATWDFRRGPFPKPDCSHFVHAVFMHAGFPYDYVASRDVFSGIDHFRRVTNPQPGDVIVWQGHIGIVVDPRRHSFYSALTSGFAISSYQSAYWTARGTTRFYRFFLIDPPLFLPSTDPPIAPLFVPSFGEAIPPSDELLSSQMQAFQGQPPVLPRTSAHHSSQRDLGQRHLLPGQVRPAVIAQRPTSMQASESATQHAPIDDQVFVTSRATPSKEEVLAAILRSADANGEWLMQRGLDSQPSVGIVDRFRIAALNIQDTSGLALLELKQIATFQYGRAIPARSMARRNVILSRQKKGWILLMPGDLMCLSQHLAVIALHDHVSAIMLAQEDSPDLKTSLRLLNDLLSERGSGHPAGHSD